MTFGTRRVYPSFWRRSRLLHVQPINVAASSKHREVPTVLLFHCLLLSQVEGMELRTFLEIRPCVLSRYSAILSALASSVLSAPYRVDARADRVAGRPPNQHAHHYKNEAAAPRTIAIIARFLAGVID
jgi:hypothetical protein